MPDAGSAPSLDGFGHPLLDVAIGAAIAAGDLLRARWPAGRTVETKSSPTDVVTEMDRASEDLVVSRILGQRPDDGILGEERGERPSRSGVRWVVDPLDGTVNYLYGLPSWCVAIAAEEHGRAAAGVVAAPALGEAFTAYAGGAALRWRLDAGRLSDPVPMAVSSQRDLGMALVATGFEYDAGRRARQAAVLPTLLPRVRDIRRNGAAALDICWTACGRIDAYYESGLNPWDLAGAAVIARAAGAVVRGIGRPDPGTDGVIVAPAVLADALEAILAGGVSPVA